MARSRNSPVLMRVPTKIDATSRPSEIFFFKQKTAYEVRPCDWSSDVCSSDLMIRRHGDERADRRRRAGQPPLLERRRVGFTDFQLFPHRSEERRVGKECTV